MNTQTELNAEQPASRFSDSGKNFTQGGTLNVALDDSPARIPLTVPKVNDRISAVDPDTNMRRNGTVMEVWEPTRYVRVRFDLKWMHDWLPATALTIIAS